MKRQRVYGRAGRPDRFYVDGVEVDQLTYERAAPEEARDVGEMLAAGTPPACPFSSTWPLKSEALGVLPKRAVQENERLKREGLNARIAKDGTAILPSAADKAALIKNLVDTGRLPPGTTDKS